MDNKKNYPTYSYVKYPGLKDYHPIVSAITQEMFDSTVNYVPDPDDVFVITYPKCGTTWLNNILYLMRNNGKPVIKGENIADHCPFIELIGGPATKDSPRPRYIKSHLYYEMLPQHPEAKYLFVARNPKDCVVSFYHHTIGYEQFYHWNDGKFEDYFEIFMSGKCDWGDYFEMVPKWYERSMKQDNILFLMYEDMVENLQREVLRIAQFLGPAWKESLEREDGKLLKEVIKHSSFPAMKAQEEKYFYPGRPDDRPFLRKGGVGTWKNELSAEQSARIDAKLTETGQKWKGFDKLWLKYKDL